ncbi:MAG: poly-gamma-glutamate system protein [Candidatus Cloacimonetes bacterium]|nr:poly-gamma-glutamate system protein [Candidatus Cloacimonadota bacterium]
MFIPSAKSKLSLIAIFLFSIVLFIWVDSSRVFVKEKNFEEKYKAAKLMHRAEKVIKEYRISQNTAIDEVNDPNKTMLIGEKNTLITTDRGNLTAKLTSLNPNFAAVMIDLFKKAKLKKGDKVAVSCTGSFPGINLAVMSAAKVLDIDLIMISSVGASMFGATDTSFTWLDIETLLNDKEIFTYKSIAASLGGGRDMGRSLTKKGRKIIEETISENNIQLIHEESLEKNIKAKMKVFKKYADREEIKLYINIGGGLSSLGSTINGRLVSPGFHRHLYLKNLPVKGTMFLFAEEGIPILHLLDIIKITEKYELPIAPEPLPEPGTGRVFEDERYNITVAAIALAIMIILILLVIFFDHKQLKLKEEEINL